MKTTLRSTTLLLLAVFIASSAWTQQAPFHSVKAKNGDGTFTLLRKHGLLVDNCNLTMFYKLNSLNPEEHLIQERVYTLPVYLYSYDGVSIRTSINDDDFDKALRIQKFNEKLKKNGLRKTNYQDSRILWVPYHELSCGEGKIAKKIVKENEADFSKDISTTTDKKPVNKDVYFHEPLFGKKFSSVKKFDNQLKGKVYYVVSGHGGPDPGAMCEECSNPMCEDEYAYDVTLRLARNLMQHGATVHVIIQDKNDGIRTEKDLVCDRDERCMGTMKLPINQKARLRQRSEAINKLYLQHKRKGVKYQQAIFIHVDSRPNKKHRQDVFFYYYKKSKSSKKLANSLQDTFKEKYQKYQKSRGYKGFTTDRNLYVLRNTYPTAAYVELANIRNPNDQVRIIKDENRQALANWLFEGMTGIK